jgi:hypothetical protein
METLYYQDRLLYGSASSAPQLIGDIVSLLMSRGASPTKGAWLGLACGPFWAILPAKNSAGKEVQTMETLYYQDRLLYGSASSAPQLIGDIVSLLMSRVFLRPRRLA